MSDEIAIIFDTETTGIPKHPTAKDEIQPRIIEFAAAVVSLSSWEVISTHEVLINPGVKLEPIITKITGLTDDDLADKPAFKEVWDGIAPLFLAADIMVAHNLPFDQTMIQLELDRNDLTLERWPRGLCTVQESAELWGRRPRLIELYEHLVGKPFAQKHRALDDVMALVEVCRLMPLRGAL